MNKIPTIFLREPLNLALVTPEWHPGCLWVRDGAGFATHKWDGTSVRVRNGLLYKRRELRLGDVLPPGFESLGTDPNTLKTVGWVPVGPGPEDKYHREAFRNDPDGTYELLGPKVQGGRYGFPEHVLVRHGAERLPHAPRTFEGLRDYLAGLSVEGIVWHHDDGRMAKIKRRDFGLKW